MSSNTCKQVLGKDLQVGDMVFLLGGYAPSPMNPIKDSMYGCRGVVRSVTGEDPTYPITIRWDGHHQNVYLDSDAFEVGHRAAQRTTCDPVNAPLLALSDHLILGELESIDQLKWGEKYYLKSDEGELSVVLYTGKDAKFYSFHSEGDALRLFVKEELLSKPVYTPPKVGDLIRVTAKNDHDKYTELLSTPIIGRVQAVDIEGVRQVGVTIQDLVQDISQYLLKPVYEVIN